MVDLRYQADMGLHEAIPVGDWVMPSLGGPGVVELERQGVAEPKD